MRLRTEFRQLEQRVQSNAFWTEDQVRKMSRRLDQVHPIRPTTQSTPDLEPLWRSINGRYREDEKLREQVAALDQLVDTLQTQVETLLQVIRVDR